jgi:hypothetical protein
MKKICVVLLMMLSYMTSQLAYANPWDGSNMSDQMWPTDAQNTVLDNPEIINVQPEFAVVIPAGHIILADSPLVDQMIDAILGLRLQRTPATPIIIGGDQDDASLYD